VSSLVSRPQVVVVVALPPIAPPRCRPCTGKPAEVFCAEKPGLVLPSEGAPLVLATGMAYNLTLHIETKSGPVDLP